MLFKLISIARVLLTCVLASKNSILYLELAHGGHLGFYEGGLIYPNPVTWLDRALVALIGSLVLNHNESGMKSAV